MRKTLALLLLLPSAALAGAKYWGTFYGSLSGNASTATALDHSPTGCGSHLWGTGIGFNGDMSCLQPSFSDLLGTATTGQIPSLDFSKITTGTVPINQGGTGLTSTSQNYVFAGPTSGSGAPSWRLLTAGDIPTLNQNTAGNAATATAPASGSAHGAVTLNTSGAFQSVAPGSNGNVLTSNGTDWVSQAAPVSTTLTTKGDLQTFSTVNARLAVGSDGQTLVADSTQTTGLAWKAQSGGSGNNFLANADFESGTASWTATTASIASETTTIFKGAKSLKLSFSGTTGNVAQSVTPPGSTAGVSLENSAWVKTTLSTIQVCSLLAGVEIQCVAVPGDGIWHYVVATSVGAASSSSGLEIKTTATATGDVYVDDSYAGPNRNLGTVAQASYLGGAYSSSYTSATVATTAAWVNAPVTSAVYTVDGSASAPANTLFGVTFASLAPGTYKFVANGQFGTTGSPSYCAWGIADTDNGTPVDVMYPRDTLGMGGVVTGHITYTTAQTNKTFRVVFKQGTASTCQVTGAVGFSISVYYFPSQAQTAVRVDQTPAYWSGISTLHGSNTATGSPADFSTSVAGTVTTGTSSNLTCSAAAGQTGITCSLPKAGAYEVCYSGVEANSTVTTSFFIISDGSNNALTGEQYTIASTAGWNQSIGQCGYYTATAAGSATFKMRGYAYGGTITAYPTTFTVKQLGAVFPAPLLVGSVTNSTSGLARTEVAQINMSSSTYSFSQLGNWIASIARNGLGDGTITFVSGTFSAMPYCTFSLYGCNGTHFDVNAVTSSTLQLKEWANSNNAAAETCNLFLSCTGAR